MNLSSRERIMRILRSEPVDRIAVKVWGLEPGQKLLHPDYQPVYDLAVEKTDLFCNSGSSFDFIAGQAAERYETNRLVVSREWTEVQTVLHTPEGDLHQKALESNSGKPGYVMSHFVKEPADLMKLLAIPYQPYSIPLDSYFTRDAEIGDRGIVIFGLDHPGYAVQRLMGSELFALMSVDERDLLRDAIREFSRRLRRHVESALDAGLRERGKREGFVMGWVGPELLIPPLLSFKDFDEFCFDVDKPLIDLIHDAGGHVWIHSHGRMSRLINRFAEMGCDTLNPIEPPPMGDIILEDAFKEANGRVSLEGNIEIHEILQASESRLKDLIDEAVAIGARYGRFILCPSTGYMEVPQPSSTMIRNLLTYVNFGLQCAEKYRY